MTTESRPIVGIIVPCYNESEILAFTQKNLIGLLNKLIDNNIVHQNSFVAFIDDGSSDDTWKIIEQIVANKAQFRGLKLSRNFGHQAALVAGLNNYQDAADYLITIDADLQDDIEVIGEMVIKCTMGYEIVYGIRKDRKSDTLFKRYTALAFYKLMLLMGVGILYNHADFRLVSRKALNELAKFNESNLFLRGIFPLIGFPHSCVYYTRKERFAGKSKYPFQKMLAFAFDGISSFSIKPLRLITALGILLFIVSLFLASYSIYSYFFLGTVPGWTSITLPIYFLSGIQLLCIGILGEYIGKIYIETKNRPRYIIEKKL